MEDSAIIEGFLQRQESAIAAAEAAYGSYCRAIAGRILTDPQDVEECVNDTWLRAWRAIPPHRPANLALFLGKITRELAINRWHAQSAQKRGGGQYALALEELEDCLSDGGDPVSRVLEQAELGRTVSDFLRRQPPPAADLFIRRYYHLCSVRELAAEFGFSESKVKSTLFRLRKKLAEHLQKEGFL